MRFLDNLKKKNYGTIMGIDASTHVVGISVLKEGNPVALIRITLNQKEVYDRLRLLYVKMNVLIDRYHPEYMMIESPIMVQNPLTTKNLSYAAGVIISSFLDRNIDVGEVSPMTWKSWIGYKRITKHQKEDMISSLGPAVANKEMSRLRKSQVQDILIARYPYLEHQLADDNLADALGISLFAFNSLKEDPGTII